jgi:hypothetical protein
MTSATCDGCGGPLPPSLGTKPRKWCSDTCRVREFTRTHADYRNRPRAPRPRTSHDLLCQECSAPFVAHSSDALYCSTKCRSKSWTRRRRAKRQTADYRDSSTKQPTTPGAGPDASHSERHGEI